MKRWARQGNLLPSVANIWQSLGVKYESPKDAGLPSNLVHSNYYDFGPRLGFAYRVGSGNRPTVIRGGYSIFAYPESLRLLQGNTYSTLPTRGSVQFDPNNAALSPDGLPNYLLRSVPTVHCGMNSANVLPVDKPVGITRGSASVNYADPNQPTARAHEWSLLVEREIHEQHRGEDRIRRYTQLAWRSTTRTITMPPRMCGTRRRASRSHRGVCQRRSPSFRSDRLWNGAGFPENRLVE